MVSAAGNRNRFEQIYQQYIVPGQGFAGLAAALQEFDQHRKTAQHLLAQMQSAQQNASRDGVNRARAVLGRIAAKVRKAKEKRGTR
jgi:predicted metal-dependent HD superfamily phosphohydrolase